MQRGPLELGAGLVGRARAWRAGRPARSAGGGSARSAGSSASSSTSSSPACGAERHGHGHRAVELHHRRRRELGERRRTARRCGPSRSPPGSRARAWQAAIAACSAYGPRPPPSASARVERGQAAADQQPVPAPAVLVEQQDRLAGGPTRARSREAWISISATRPCTSGSLRRQPGEDAAQAQRVLAQGRAQPVVAGGRRVALVEDQVDDLEHRREARRRARGRAAPRRARAPRPASAWPGRCAGPRSARARGRRGRSPRWSARRAGAGSAPRGPRSTAPGGRP